MRQLVDIVGALFSLALVIAGGSFLFSIPGVAALVGGILMVLVGFAVCGMILERIFTLLGNSLIALRRSSRQGIDHADLAAAQ